MPLIFHFRKFPSLERLSTLEAHLSLRVSKFGGHMDYKTGVRFLWGLDLGVFCIPNLQITGNFTQSLGFRRE